MLLKRIPFLVKRSIGVTAVRAQTTLTGSNIPQVDHSSLVAFQARSGIRFDDLNVLQNALTHKSLDKEDNASKYHFVGGRALQLYVCEFVLAKYPRLPIEAAESVIKAFTDPLVMSDVGESLGIQFVMRWKGAQSEESSPGETRMRAWATQALLGAIYNEKGPAETKRFIHRHFLSRDVNLQEHLDLYAKMKVPRKLLALLVRSQKKPAPVARLIKESGRLSNRAVFVVGMYSGIEKIGQGYGSSLKMAETRAVKDALLTYYSTELKSVKLPSDIDEDDESISFLEK